MDDEKKAKRNKTLKTVLLIVLALAVMVMTLPGGQELLGQMFKFVGLRNFTSVADEFPFSVHVINVGKADSILNPKGGTLRADAIGTLILEPDKIKPEDTQIICENVMERREKLK